MRWMACALALAALAVLAVTAATEFGGSARADVKGMAAMSLDMDPDGTPANTATSLGSIEGCARINANGTLDADEDTTADTITVDVTATDIPVAAPMQGFQYILNYDEAKLTIQSSASDFLLNVTSGSSIFANDEPTPDTNGDGRFVAGALDIGPPGTEETGPGVLGQLTVSSDAGAAAGLYSLAFDEIESVHLEIGASHIANSYHNGWIAIDQECMVPTDTPAPAFKKGDNDCDGDVDTVDALKGLRHVAGLPVAQTEPCTDLGDGDPMMGDMDCDGDVDSVDALKILRHVAGLSNNLPDGCPLIDV